MTLKSYDPTSPGRRGMVKASFEEITKTAAEKSLLMPLKKKGRAEQPGHNHGASSRRRSQA